MALESALPREIKENTQVMTDPAVTVRYTLNLEVKPEKFESKVLVLGSCRCFLYTAKVPGKLEATIHYLDIQGIESFSATNLRLTLKNGKVLSFAALRAESEEINAIIAHIGSALAAVFSTVPLERLVTQLEVHPTTRAKVVQDAIRDASPKDSKPCDGFSSIYAYMCDYLGYTAIDEVTWDIDTIYSSQDARSFSLCDFSHLSSSDHVPLLAALQYSTWFTHFNAADMKLSSDMLSRILKVVKTSMALESIDLSNSGLKVDSVLKFASAITANVSSKLTDLDLSNNLLEDRGVAALSAALAKLPRGLRYINLSRTGMTAKGAGKLAEALSANGQCVSTLRVLNLSGNSLKGDEMQHLQMFLAKPNVLEELDVSGGGAALEQLISPMASGCIKHLRALKVSGNPYTVKKSKEPPPYWKQFFSTAQSLDVICLSNTSLPPTALKALLLGLSINSSAAAASATISLDVSYNGLGFEGANIISACVQVLKNIGSLDLTNNGLEDGLTEMLASFTMNSSVRHLAIGQNFAFVKSKHMASTLDALVQVMQSDHSVLESLSVSNSRLGPDTSRIINALGSNMTIKKIDLSGNDMGDDCAKMLAKALSINACLTSLSFDRNNLTATGLSDIANAIQRNLCVKDVPLPLDDIILASKLEPDRVKTAVETIQKSLLRNYTTQRIPRGSLYRLQENLHAGSAQVVIDKKLARLQSLGFAESSSSTGSKPTGQPLSVERANQLEMAKKDVANAKKAMMKLHLVAQHSETESGGMFVQVGRLSEQLVTTIQTQAQNSAQEMLQSMQEDFPFVFSFYESTKNELSAGCESRIREEEAVSYSQTSKKQIVTDARNELSRLNVSVATYLFDNVIDKLLLALDEVGRSAHVSEAPEPMSPRPPVEEPKEFRNGSIKSSAVEEVAAPTSQLGSSGSGGSASSSSTASAAAAITPTSGAPATAATTAATTAAATTTRKALLDGRKRRPQSMHQDELSAKPASSHVFGGLTRRLRKGSVGAVTQGGTSSGQDDDLDVVALPSDVPQLSHPTKDRPKPQRVHAPVQKPAADVDDQASDGSSSPKADDAIGRAADSPVPAAAAKTASTAAPKRALSSGVKQPAPKPPPKEPLESGDRGAASAAPRGKEGKDADGSATEGRLAGGAAQPSSRSGAALDRAAVAGGVQLPVLSANAMDRTGNSAAAATQPMLDTTIGENQDGDGAPRPLAPLRVKKARAKREGDSSFDTVSALPDEGPESALSLSQSSLNSPTPGATALLAGGPATAASISRDGASPAVESKRFSHVPTTGNGKNLVAELKARNQRASSGLILEESQLEGAGDFADKGKEADGKNGVSSATNNATVAAAKSIQADGARKADVLPSTALLNKLGAAPPLPTKPSKPSLAPRPKPGGPSDAAVSSVDADAPSKEPARAPAVTATAPALPGQRPAGGRGGSASGGARLNAGDGAATTDAHPSGAAAAAPASTGPGQGEGHGRTTSGSHTAGGGGAAAAVEAGSMLAEAHVPAMGVSSAILRAGPVLVPPSSGAASAGSRQQRVVSMPPDALSKHYRPHAEATTLSSSTHADVTETSFEDEV